MPSESEAIKIRPERPEPDTADADGTGGTEQTETREAAASIRPAGVDEDLPWVVARRWWILGLIFVVGVCLRMGYFAEVWDHPTSLLPTHSFGSQTDMAFYWEWSGQILAGDWLGRDTPHPSFTWMEEMGDEATWHRWWGGAKIFQSEPFYPYAIAGLRWLGLGLTGVVGVQLLVGSLAPLLIYGAARRWVGIHAALWAAGVMAVYGTLIFYTGALLRDWSVTVVDPLLLWVLGWAGSAVKARSPRWLAAGVVAGVTLWVKSTIQVFLPFLLVWIALRDGPRSAWRQWPAVVLLILGMGLGLSPLIGRNLAVGAPATAVSNRPIEGFVVANVDSNFHSLGFSYDPVLSAEVLERAGGSTKAAIVETLKTYEGNWGMLPYRFWIKFRGLVDPFEIPNNLSPDYGREVSATLAVLPGWPVVLPWAVAGLLLVGLRRPKRHGLLLLYGVAAMIAVLTLFVLARYRLTILPFVAIYAGVGVAWWVASWADRRWGRVVLGAVVVAGASLVQWQVMALPVVRGLTGKVAHPLSYKAAVIISMERGDPATAMDALRRWQFHMEGLPRPAAVRMQDQIYGMEAAVIVYLVGAELRAGRADVADSYAPAYREIAEQAVDVSGVPPLAIPYARAGQWATALVLAEDYLKWGTSERWREQCAAIAEQAREQLTQTEPAPPSPGPRPGTPGGSEQASPPD